MNKRTKRWRKYRRILVGIYYSELDYNVLHLVQINIQEQDKSSDIEQQPPSSTANIAIYVKYCNAATKSVC